MTYIERLNYYLPYKTWKCEGILELFDRMKGQLIANIYIYNDLTFYVSQEIYSKAEIALEVYPDRFKRQGKDLRFDGIKILLG
jgi:hypothetical protein